MHENFLEGPARRTTYLVALSHTRTTARRGIAYPQAHHDCESGIERSRVRLEDALSTRSRAVDAQVAKANLTASSPASASNPLGALQIEVTHHEICRARCSNSSVRSQPNTRRSTRRHPSTKTCGRQRYRWRKYRCRNGAVPASSQRRLVTSSESLQLATDEAADLGLDVLVHSAGRPKNDEVN